MQKGGGIIARMKCWGEQERMESRAEIEQLEMHLSNSSILTGRKAGHLSTKGDRLFLFLWLLFSKQNEMRCHELMVRWKQECWPFGVGEKM